MKITLDNLENKSLTESFYSYIRSLEDLSFCFVLTGQKFTGLTIRDDDVMALVRSGRIPFRSDSKPEVTKVPRLFKQAGVSLINVSHEN